MSVICEDWPKFLSSLFFIINFIWHAFSNGCIYDLCVLTAFITFFIRMGRMSQTQLVNILFYLQVIS